MGSRNLLGGKVWPNNTVPYILAGGFSKDDLSLIQSAMDGIEKKTCVRWVPRNGEKSYVYIKNDESGCFAVLGYNEYRGKHVLNLQRSNGFSTCMIFGIAQHEMLHILGYGHEQTRPDRDSYVRIHWDMIQRDAISNYFKSIYDNTTIIPPQCRPRSTATTFDDCYSGFTTDTFGYPYEYGSVMHYGLDDFQTSDKNTMDVLRSVPFGIRIGQRIGMTELDALKVKAKYNCDQLSTLSTTSPTNASTSPTNATTTVSVCEDKWIYCQSMPEWCSNKDTSKNCQKTCKLCPEDINTTTTTFTTPNTTTSVCEDKWIYCDSMREWCPFKYTSENCQKTCKLCPEDINTTTTTTTFTTANTTTSVCEDKWIYCDSMREWCPFKYTSQNCRKTCKLCPEDINTTTTTTFTTANTTTSDCFDKFDTCGEYLSYCSDKMIADNCPRSCQLCPGQGQTTTKKPDTNCVDSSSNCEGLKDFCYHSYLKENCKATCGIC
ncbi:zinc metalloproteinase nas-6 isoform X1 [Lepeophtheirus salmonis]|uniref:zinc metalloproteinase nas-6 isoform X1 n=1 Tax=Lepeophtheirus salmonis TaxID=72036 RepID=UPI001AEA94E1|nr:zinc metalloproteinase nas-14-like isoform X1 [Lepeophtheirus salmonis]